MRYGFAICIGFCVLDDTTIGSEERKDGGREVMSARIVYAGS
jgi:hypothetical protein